MGLFVWTHPNFIWFYDFVLFKQLRALFSQGESLRLKELSLILSCSFPTKSECIILIRLSEGVAFLISVINIALISKPY